MNLFDEQGEKFAFAYIEYRFVDDAGLLFPSTTCQNQFWFDRRGPGGEPKDYWPFD